MSRTVLVSDHATVRIDAAIDWLGARRDEPVVIVATTLEAAEQLAARAVDVHGSSAGWECVTFDRLAFRLASRELALAALAPAAPSALEALTTRIIHRLTKEAPATLGRFGALADRPGLARALASTLSELAHADIAPAAVAEVAPELSALMTEQRRELAGEGLADRARILEAAARAASGPPPSPREAALLVLDVKVRHRLEADVLGALLSRVSSALVTMPRADERSRALLAETIELEAPSEDEAPAPSPIRELQERLFAPHVRAAIENAPLEIFSAPGESRECAEIARRILAEARAGTPFDRIAVLLRAPDLYRAPIAEAFARASIPTQTWRAARRPDPSGRALLALIDCALERLSARAFAEYLSLAVVPDADAEGRPPLALSASERFVPSDDELDEDPGADRIGAQASAGLDEDDAYDEEAPVRAGTLRAPRRWEALIVDAAVIGGHDRWQRRLRGLLTAARAELAQLDDPDGPEARAIDRRIHDLEALSAFALPLIDDLARLPERAPWGTWLDALGALATRSIRAPDRVLAVLAALRPMAHVGPIELSEVRAVLEHRLRDEVGQASPPDRVAGVIVASIDEARGREFDVVFVPGLAERVFPIKLAEDPLLLDRLRERISPALATTPDRARDERLLLAIAIGAARRKIVTSYPRLDAERMRPRVPSFYLLELERARTGELPSYEALARDAEGRADAHTGWPAPRDPDAAIDESERDLSVLGAILRLPPPERKGRAAYLMSTSETAGRALRARWSRWDRKRWRPADGLVEPDAGALAILADHAPDKRPYSATALEAYSLCPYRFFLRSVVRLEPREDPLPIEELDPAQRGTLIHDVQFRLLTVLRERGQLPITKDNLAAALEALGEVMSQVEADHREQLAPAILRVWREAIEGSLRDLREWLRRAADEPEWTPRFFELAFGLGRQEGRDGASRSEPVPLSAGLRLRGSIDVVEERDRALRATDYKTGSAWGTKDGQRIAGGEKLQPLLYAMALEALFPETPIAGGRLYYCTARGDFTEVDVPLDEPGRAAIEQVVGTVGDAIARGFLPAAPKDKACGFCDYVAVCGPDEGRRASRKPQEKLAPLSKLRGMP